MKHLRLQIAAAIVLMAGPISTGHASSTNLVSNAGFEMTEPIGDGLPSSYGDWNGNYASFHAAENGITPHSGSQMLRFDGTQSVGDGAGASIGGDVFQIIDVSAYSSSIAQGRVVVSLSAYFNRVAGDAQTDTQFGVSIYAYSGTPSQFPTQALSGYLIRQTNYLLSDANPSTWQSLSTQALLPANTSYIAVSLDVVENVFNDLAPPEFDGHYVDDVVLTIDVPCTGDVNANGEVDIDDLFEVINDWGPCS